MVAAVRPAIAAVISDAASSDPKLIFTDSSSSYAASAFAITGTGDFLTDSSATPNGAKNVGLLFDDGSKHIARVVATDFDASLALLHVDGLSAMPHLVLSQRRPSIGEFAAIIGNSRGWGAQYVPTYVSQYQTSREFPGRHYVGYVGTVDISMAGAPILGQDGTVIGMVAQDTGLEPSEYSSLGPTLWALPGINARVLASQLLSSGKIERGVLGLGIQALTTDEAESLGLPNTDGALVSSVTESSAAAKAGVQTGDVILAVAKTPIGSPVELAQLAADIGPNVSTSLTVYRNKQSLLLSVTTAAASAPDDASQPTDTRASSPFDFSNLPPETASMFSSFFNNSN